MRKSLVILVVLAMGGIVVLRVSKSDVASHGHVLADQEPLDENLTEVISPKPNEIEKGKEVASIANARELHVTQKLKKFLDRTKSLNDATIRDERLRVAKGFEIASKKPTEMPCLSNVIDENEQAWIRLEFGNGIIRYALKELD